MGLSGQPFVTLSRRPRLCRHRQRAICCLVSGRAAHSHALRSPAITDAAPTSVCVPWTRPTNHLDDRGLPGWPH